MATIKRLLPYVKPHHAEILEYQLHGRFEDTCESDELLDARSLTLINERFPWMGSYYDSLHRYSSPNDPSGLLYGDVSECEEFYNQFKHDFFETLWAQYTYNGDLVYDGTSRYGVATMEHETLYLGQQITMYDAASETEGFNNTLNFYIRKGILKMLLREPLKDLKGHLSIKVFRGGKLYRQEETDNLIVTQGRLNLSEIIIRRNRHACISRRHRYWYRCGHQYRYRFNRGN